MKDLSDHRIVIRPLRIEHAPGVIVCYRQIYGEADAWREFMVCENCKRLWSIKEWNEHLKRCEMNNIDFSQCSCGLGRIHEYWPREVIQEELDREVFRRKGSISFAAFDNNNRIIGLIWGYEALTDQLQKEKNIPDLIEKVLKEFGSGSVFYQSEWGVLSQFQGIGLGAALFWARLEKAVNRDHKVGIYRTTPEAQSFKILPKYGYRELYRYDPPDGKGATRVILGAWLKEVRGFFSADKVRLFSKMVESW